MKHWIESHPIGGQRHCGDFAAHLRLEASRHAVIIGDISGRGIDAGNAAIALHARVRDLLTGSTALNALLFSASDFFTQTIMNDAIPFASLFIAVIDERAGVMHYASAGHEPGLLFRANGAHEHLEPTGPVFGLPAIPDFRERTRSLYAGDTLVVVTDGITEARRTENCRLNFFGSTGVVRTVRAASALGHDPAHAICHAAFTHAEGRVTDDASALAVSVGGTQDRFRYKARLRVTA
jgi:serine phosphatase RsbU (regulator of sigma subunit)